MDVRARKAATRRLVLSRRSRLATPERELKARAIATRVLDLEPVRSASTVLAYVSHASEVPTRGLLSALLERGTRLLVPYVAGDGAMRATEIPTLGELEPGYRGIHEPVHRFPVEPGTAQVILLPGVAFDARGGRLGYGGGFYDVYLAHARGVLRVGVCFELQVVDEVPMEPHDQGVDLVVTEERVIEAHT